MSEGRTGKSVGSPLGWIEDRLTGGLSTGKGERWRGDERV